MNEVVTEHPEEFLGYWVINPHSPEITARDLRGFHTRSGFVGLKFWPDYHLVPVTSPKYARRSSTPTNTACWSWFIRSAKAPLTRRICWLRWPSDTPVPGF